MSLKTNNNKRKVSLIKKNTKKSHNETKYIFLCSLDLMKI